MTTGLTAQLTPDVRRARLRETLRKAARSSFYASSLADHTSDDFAGADFDLLEKLPSTSKDALREAGLGILSVPLERTVRYYESSGTTGRPTPTPKTRLDIESNTAGLLLHWQRILRPGADKAVLLLPSDIAPVADAMVYGLEELGVLSVRAFPFTRGVSGWDPIVRICRDLGINTVLTTPGLAVHFRRELELRGHDPREFGIEKILLLGELLTEPMRAMLERAWAAEVYINSYGSSEVGTCSTSCDRRAMHLFEHMYHFEWLEPGTDLPTDADIGELVVTTLTADARPLLRYRTGDLVRRSAQPCPCGSPLPVIEVLGRVFDELDVGGRTVRPFELETVVYSVEDVQGYLIRVDGDRTVLCVEVMDGRHDAGNLERIARETTSRLAEEGLPFEVEVSLDFNETTKRGGGFKNWKLTHVVRT